MGDTGGRARGKLTADERGHAEGDEACKRQRVHADDAMIL